MEYHGRGRGDEGGYRGRDRGSERDYQASDAIFKISIFALTWMKFSEILNNSCIFLYFR